MRVKQIEYSMLKTDMATFNNEKVGIVVEMDEGESEFRAFARARKWVNDRLKPPVSRPSLQDVAAAQEVLKRDREKEPEDPF